MDTLISNKLVNANDEVLKPSDKINSSYQFKAKKIQDLYRPIPKLSSENVRLNSAQFDRRNTSILEDIPTNQQSSPDVRVKNFFNFNFGAASNNNNPILKLIEASYNINAEQSQN